MTAEQIRAAALTAACIWRPWSPSEPEPDAIDSLLTLADRFARWIEGDE